MNHRNKRPSSLRIASEGSKEMRAFPSIVHGYCRNVRCLIEAFPVFTVAHCAHSLGNTSCSFPQTIHNKHTGDIVKTKHIIFLEQRCMHNFNILHYSIHFKSCYDFALNPEFSSNYPTNLLQKMHFPSNKFLLPNFNSVGSTIHFGFLY